jgi:putative FmdB family regulatory protein
MPIYEYVCEHCRHQFELLLRGSEKPVCPSCGRSKLNKLLSVPAAHVASSKPSCPARDLGVCGMPQCGGGLCGLEGGG